MKLGKLARFELSKDRRRGRIIFGEGRRTRFLETQAELIHEINLAFEDGEISLFEIFELEKRILYSKLTPTTNRKKNKHIEELILARGAMEQLLPMPNPFSKSPELAFYDDGSLVLRGPNFSDQGLTTLNGVVDMINLRYLRDELDEEEYDSFLKLVFSYDELERVPFAQA